MTYSEEEVRYSRVKLCFSRVNLPVARANQPVTKVWDWFTAAAPSTAREMYRFARMTQGFSVAEERCTLANQHLAKARSRITGAETRCSVIPARHHLICDLIATLSL